jgi:hypothetical protein
MLAAPPLPILWRTDGRSSAVRDKGGVGAGLAQIFAGLSYEYQAKTGSRAAPISEGGGYGFG